MRTESVKSYTWSRQWLAEVREYANIRHKYGQTWLGEMARLEGFEPSTLGSEDWRMLSQEVNLRTSQYFMLS